LKNRIIKTNRKILSEPLVN